jgi:hypothetical protein
MRRSTMRGSRPCREIGPSSGRLFAGFLRLAVFPLQTLSHDAEILDQRFDVLYGQPRQHSVGAGPRTPRPLTRRPSCSART